MHEDVDAAELLAHRVGDSRASLRRSNIRRNEFDFADILGTFARRRKHPRACLAERRHDRRAHAFRAARHERALALQFEVAAHERISSERIFPSASTKLKFTVIGLPGKLPVSLALRMFWPPRSASSSGATVWPYFFFVAAIQFSIAATPRRSGLRRTRSHQARSTPSPLRVCRNLQ